MAAKEGGVTFLQECDHWRVSYAQVDRPTPMHMQAAQTGFSGLLETNNGYEGGKVKFWNVPDRVRGRIWFNMIKTHGIRV